MCIVLSQQGFNNMLHQQQGTSKMSQRRALLCFVSSHPANEWKRKSHPGPSTLSLTFLLSCYDAFETAVVQDVIVGKQTKCVRVCD